MGKHIVCNFHYGLYYLNTNMYKLKGRQKMKKVSIRIISTILSLMLALSIVILPASAENETAKTYKNIIFMIGDGMGKNTIDLAMQERSDFVPFMRTAPCQGFSETRSANKDVTDSAAGGTALACGVRTNNSAVGVYPIDITGLFSAPQNLCELAKSLGKKAGVVTTDSTDGATPATFSVHTSDRDNSKDIGKQQAKSNLDLIWGGKSSDLDKELVAKKGFKLIENITEMNNITAGQRSFAQFNKDEIWKLNPVEGQPTLEQMTDKALKLLDNENGFFVMIEGAHIDKNSHNNNAKGCAEAVEEFDNAIKVAVDFAKEKGDTLVIITADHETGGITYNESTKRYEYTSGSHSGVNVPVYVFGCDTFFEKNGDSKKNCDISSEVAILMGGNSPVRTPGKLFKWFFEFLEIIIK